MYVYFSAHPEDCFNEEYTRDDPLFCFFFTMSVRVPLEDGGERPLQILHPSTLIDECNKDIIFHFQRTNRFAQSGPEQTAFHMLHAGCWRRVFDDQRSAR